MKTRVAKSIRNSKAALLYSVLLFVGGFFSRKVFLERLGAELLGLNTTASDLLQFLNLAELGIGLAIASTLYKPLFNNDHKIINEIVSIQGWLYRRVAYIIIVASVVLMCFFPIIFAKSNIPLWCAYATFIVLLFSSLLDYFVNYKQVVLSANQEQYMIYYNYHIIKLFRYVFQIVAILYFEYSYIWWLFFEVLFTIIASKALNVSIKKSAPYLRTNIELTKDLRNKYPDMIKKIKQLFVHKVSGFVLIRMQSLLIYAYTSLTIVAYYGNYMFVVSGLRTIITSFFTGMSASVGNMIAEGNENLIMKVFSELYTIRFFVVSVLTFWVYIITPQFIVLWLGENYIMSNTTVILMFIIFFIQGIKITVEEYINAHGMFYDIWAPIVESVISLGGGLILGNFYGINGVLIGTILSQIIITLLWKPYFLFVKGLKKSIFVYAKLFLQNVLVLCVAILLVYNINIYQFSKLMNNEYTSFAVFGLIVLIIVSMVMFVLQYTIISGMRGATSRILRPIFTRFIHCTK